MQSLRNLLVVAAGAALAGCYSLQPVSAASPELGTVVAVDVNDAGRAALNQAVGPEVRQLEGRLVQRSEAELLLAVTAVRTFRGGEQVWKGERVTLKPEHVGNTYEKRFSTGRTLIASALTIGAFVALATSGIVPGIGGENPPPNNKPDPDALRPRTLAFPQR
jgi:hypothetical protein